VREKGPEFGRPDISKTQQFTARHHPGALNEPRLSKKIRAGMPPTVGRSIRTGNHDAVTVRIAHPALPVVGAAITIRRIAMARQQDFDTHFHRTLHDRVEVFHFKPEQHTIAIRSVVGIADGTVVMLDVKTVQLQNELTVLHQLLILRASVNSTAAQQALIPLAAGLYIRNANEWLGAHAPSLYRTPAPCKQISKNSETRTSVCDDDDGDGGDDAPRHSQEQPFPQIQRTQWRQEPGCETS